VKSHSVTTTTQSTDVISTPTATNAPVVTAAKSPTCDVACGTDLEFHSKYFNVDDGGLLRQLSAEDVAEVLRRRVPSSSLSSPTCDVACNTEYDSRPCTPARVDLSRYYAVAADEPMPPTAVDVACGPDTPGPELCDAGCETEDCVEARSSGVNVAIPPTMATHSGSDSLQSPPYPESTERIERRVLPLAPTDEPQQHQKMLNAAAETQRPPSSQDQACDTSDLPGPASQAQIVEPSLSDEGRPTANLLSRVGLTERRRTRDVACNTEHDLKPCAAAVANVQEEPAERSHSAGSGTVSATHLFKRLSQVR